MESSSTHVSNGAGAGWQLLGDFELPIGTHADGIRSWLAELLTPLDLNHDFVAQLLSSAQDASLRASHSNHETSFKHIHISVFTPNERDSQRNTWGFFRIEKLDSVEENKDHPEYVVEFYLYLEG
jgi:hypothetical protein